MYPSNVIDFEEAMLTPRKYGAHTAVHKSHATKGDFNVIDDVMRDQLIYKLERTVYEDELATASVSVPFESDVDVTRVADYTAARNFGLLALVFAGASVLWLPLAVLAFLFAGAGVASAWTDAKHEGTTELPVTGHVTVKADVGYRFPDANYPDSGSRSALPATTQRTTALPTGSQMRSPYCIDTDCDAPCWGCITLELDDKGTDSMESRDIKVSFTSGVVPVPEVGELELENALGAAEGRIDWLERELAEVANRLSDEEREHNKTRIELHAYREGVQDGRGADIGGRVGLTTLELPSVDANGIRSDELGYNVAGVNDVGYQRSGWLN